MAGGQRHKQRAKSAESPTATPETVHDRAKKGTMTAKKSEATPKKGQTSTKNGATTPRKSKKLKPKPLTRVVSREDLKHHGPTEYVRLGIETANPDADPPDMIRVIVIIIKRAIVGKQAKTEFRKVDSRDCNGMSIGDAGTGDTFQASDGVQITYDPFWTTTLDNTPSIATCRKWLLDGGYANPPAPGEVLASNAIRPVPGMLIRATGSISTMNPGPSGTRRNKKLIDVMVCARDFLTGDESLNLPGDWRGELDPVEDDYLQVRAWMLEYLRHGRGAEYKGQAEIADDYHGEPELRTGRKVEWDLEIWIQPQAAGCIEIYNWSAERQLSLNSFMDRSRSANPLIGRKLYVEARIVSMDKKKRQAMAEEAEEDAASRKTGLDAKNKNGKRKSAGKKENKQEPGEREPDGQGRDPDELYEQEQVERLSMSGGQEESHEPDSGPEDEDDDYNEVPQSAKRRRSTTATSRNARKATKRPRGKSIFSAAAPTTPNPATTSRDHAGADQGLEPSGEEHEDESEGEAREKAETRQMMLGGLHGETTDLRRYSQDKLQAFADRNQEITNRSVEIARLKDQYRREKRAYEAGQKISNIAATPTHHAATGSEGPERRQTTKQADRAQAMAPQLQLDGPARQSLSASSDARVVLSQQRKGNQKHYMTKTVPEDPRPANKAVEKAHHSPVATEPSQDLNVRDRHLAASPDRQLNATPAEAAFRNSVSAEPCSKSHKRTKHKDGTTTKQTDNFAEVEDVPSSPPLAQNKTPKQNKKGRGKASASDRQIAEPAKVASPNVIGDVGKYLPSQAVKNAERRARAAQEKRMKEMRGAVTDQTMSGAEEGVLERGSINRESDKPMRRESHSRPGHRAESLKKRQRAEKGAEASKTHPSKTDRRSDQQ